MAPQSELKHQDERPPMISSWCVCGRSFTCWRQHVSKSEKVQDGAMVVLMIWGNLAMNRHIVYSLQQTQRTLLSCELTQHPPVFPKGDSSSNPIMLCCVLGACAVSQLVVIFHCRQLMFKTPAFDVELPHTSWSTFRLLGTRSKHVKKWVHA